MKKVILLFLMTIIYLADGQEIPIPTNYSVVDSVSGDLDNDLIAELVVVYNKEIYTEDYIGFPRELVIYKLQNNQWIEWRKSDQALYGSEEGGAMGDPFGGIEIKNGILSIIQYGGSSWKWGGTDKYRFQNGEFYLIGYTSLSGKICEYWETVDFNLSTGKIIVKKEFENCETEEQKIYKRENEILYKKGVEITIHNRQERDIKIITPKYGHEIYIAIKK
ncbi:MAG: hypothetical protein ACK5IC_08305 [Moheibacter sp.]